MKKQAFCLLLGLLFSLSGLQAQQWDWNGRPADAHVKRKIEGMVKKLASDFDCSSYAYGKTRYHKYDVYSYSKSSSQVRFEVRFEWQIDYDFWPSKQFSYTIEATMDNDGCNSRFSFNAKTGGSGCDCEVGGSYSAGCIY